MRKRLTFILALLLAAAMPLTALAAQPQSLTISTAGELLEFAENCRLDSYSRDLQVRLTADIQLEGLEFQGIPIFSGSFDGGGHTVSGLNITAEGSVQGLFRYLTDSAVVQDLCVEGKVVPQGSASFVGGIAGSNAGTVENCSFTGSVSGSDAVGGLVGSNALTGILQGCSMNGSVDGNHFAGGLAGENTGVIRHCVNYASVNTTVHQNVVEISDITIDTLTGSESPATVTDIGGITGTNTGVIRSCENRGAVGYKHMGYNIGGIAGSHMGYIADCENYGAVSGRKEIGGIAGQMEPVVSVEYSEDTLQILQQQLDTMGTLAGQTTASAQSGTAAISSQIAAIEDQAKAAQEALEQLLPTVSDPEEGLPEVTLPDPDALQAAQNTLAGSISGMQGSLRSIAATTQASANALTGNLQAISDQVGAMSQTVGGASQNLGGSITDISDMDTPEDLTGKLADCENHGPVLGDLNTGGICGAIALESDLDPDADIQITGDSSLNFDSMLRAVILDSKNTGSVTAGKQNTGGIVGWMSMGLVKNSVNSGALSGGDYTGGIAGSSAGFIRFCSVKCEILADSWAGGIAGTGKTVTDCRSMVQMEAREKKGAVLGYAENREELSGNFYLPIREDPGAVDGISYDGKGQALEMAAFLELDGLNKMFRTVTVQFIFEDGTEKAVYLAPGEKLKESDIPLIPEKKGYTARWADLENLEIAFDSVYQVEYTLLSAVLQSSQCRESGRPVLLAEGAFPPESAIRADASEEVPAVEGALLEALRIAVPEAGENMTLRYLPPVSAQGENLVLYLRTPDADWQAVSFTADGSYLVFSASGGELGLALFSLERGRLPWAAIAVAAAAILALAVWLLCRRRKPSWAGQQASEEV